MGIGVSNPRPRIKLLQHLLFSIHLVGSDNVLTASGVLRDGLWRCPVFQFQDAPCEFRRSITHHQPTRAIDASCCWWAPDHLCPSAGQLVRRHQHSRRSCQSMAIPSRWNIRAGAGHRGVQPGVRLSWVAASARVACSSTSALDDDAVLPATRFDLCRG